MQLPDYEYDGEGADIEFSTEGMYIGIESVGPLYGEHLGWSSHTLPWNEVEKLYKELKKYYEEEGEVI